MKIKEGDYFYTKNDEDSPVTYNVYHCLKLEKHPEFETAHVSAYYDLSEIPSVNEISSMEVSIDHTPIDADGFNDPVLIGNKPVLKEELEGYYIYLKQVDFESYLAETDQKLEDVIDQAQKFYLEGNEFAEKGLFEDALGAYSEALDIFPQFVEAADNLALTYMDLEELENAIEWFNYSIEINGNTSMTDMSICECYAKLGDTENSKIWLDFVRKNENVDPEELKVFEQHLLAL